jgi:hypothetical protein
LNRQSQSQSTEREGKEGKDGSAGKEEDQLQLYQYQ